MSRYSRVNMTPFEDEALCRVYVQKSIDSTNGANQTTNRIWQSIVTKYNAKPVLIYINHCKIQKKKWKIKKRAITSRWYIVYHAKGFYPSYNADFSKPIC